MPVDCCIVFAKLWWKLLHMDPHSAPDSTLLHHDWEGSLLHNVRENISCNRISRCCGIQSISLQVIWDWYCRPIWHRFTSVSNQLNVLKTFDHLKETVKNVSRYFVFANIRHTEKIKNGKKIQIKFISCGKMCNYKKQEHTVYIVLN